MFANGSSRITPERTSSSSTFSHNDPVVQCIVARAAEVQGYIPTRRIELLQLMYYQEGQEFQPHYDWTANKHGYVEHQESTVFSVLDGSCENCGTNYPRLLVDWSTESKSWCAFFDCDSETLTTIPVPGSALYWRNVHSNGTGDRRTLHAGLPVASGYKAGINIWTSPS